MGFLDFLQFSSPLALWGLLALPVIWWLLRFVPPRPRPQDFPPIRILLGIDPKQETPDKTPWWLLLLRLGLAGLLVFGVAQPFMSKNSASLLNGGSVLVVVDDGWAAAPHWTKIQTQLREVIAEARQAGQLVTIATTTPSLAARDFETMSAADAITRANVLKPTALSTERLLLADLLQKKQVQAGKIVWLSDGVKADDFAAKLSAVFPSASVEVYAPGLTTLPLALAQPAVSGSDIIVKAMKPAGYVLDKSLIQLRAKNGRIIAEGEAVYEGDVAQARVSLPVELRNEVQAISIAGQEHAAARHLLDDRFRRKTVAIQQGSNFEAAQPLLSHLSLLQKFQNLQRRLILINDWSQGFRFWCWPILV
jgi:hypothetical protein